LRWSGVLDISISSCGPGKDNVQCEQKLMVLFVQVLFASKRNLFYCLQHIY
jgi:hypothetical protein